MQTAIIIIAILAVAIFAVGFYYYLQYSHWPPAIWKKQLKAKLAEYQAAIDKVDRDPSAQAEQKLMQQRLDAALHAIPMDRLTDYPNIGPKTVEALVAGNFTRIDQLWSLNWWHSVPGIGDVRAKALTEAAKTIKSDFETKFNAGQNPEGKAWFAERDQLRDQNRAAAEERTRIKAAALRAQKEIQQLVNLSESVSFPAFLMHRNNSPITSEVMSKPFPEMILDDVKPAPTTPVVKESKPAKPDAVTTTAAPAVAPATAPPVSSPISSPATPTSSSPVSPPAVIEVDETLVDRMRAYCRFGFVISRADGRVAVGEKKEIRTFLASTFGSNDRILRFLDPVIEQCENPPPVEDDAVAAIKAITTLAQREELMSWARRIADIVGDRNQKEQKLLDRIAEALELGGQPAASPSGTASAPSSGNVSNPRAVLEIDTKVELSPELIRRRFNILTDQYDPKRAASLGAAFVAKAEEMRAAVKAAAEALIAPFGVPLVPPTAPPAAASGDIRHNPDLDAVFGM